MAVVAKYNPYVKGAVTAFNGVNVQGTSHSITGGPSNPIPIVSHVQGMALYKNLMLISWNVPGAKHGCIEVVSTASWEYLFQFKTAHRSLNHPCGMQVVGDYLVLALESGGTHASFIDIYDLTTLDVAKPGPPTLLYSIDRTKSPNASGAGGVGMTRYQWGESFFYILAAYNDGELDVYGSTADDITTLPSSPSFPIAKGLLPTDYSTVSLVTELPTSVPPNPTMSSVYMIGFHTVDGSDYADLWGLGLIQGTATKVAELHVYTNWGLPGTLGIHFRWAAGLYFGVPGADGTATFGLLAAMRGSIPGVGTSPDILPINVFDPAQV